MRTSRDQGALDAPILSQGRSKHDRQRCVIPQFEACRGGCPAALAFNFEANPAFCLLISVQMPAQFLERAFT
jgi:hypothetical protein